MHRDRSVAQLDEDFRDWQDDAPASSDEEMEEYDIAELLDDEQQ